jgi:hypothetical protein
MKLVYKTGLVALILVSSLSVLVGHVYYSKQEFSKTIKKEYSISPTGTASLQNKYGNIVIQTWEKDRVKVEVTILVRAKNEAESQRVFDQINIAFSNTQDRLSVATEIEESGSWWGGSQVKGDFSINYLVLIPTTLNLEVGNKYGNVDIAECKGRAEIELKYGNLQADGFGGDVDLVFGYGNAQFGSVRDLQTTLSNAVVEIGTARDVLLESKYSNVSVGNVRELRSEAKYDELKISKANVVRFQAKFSNLIVREAENVNAIAKYSDIRIDELRNSADLDLEYGAVKVNKIARGFSEVRMAGAYTDFAVEVESGASYQLDASADYAGIIYPSGMEISRMREAGVSQEVVGHMGTPNARSVIRARLDYGGLRLQ